jgi:hypothetical protein
MRSIDANIALERHFDTKSLRIIPCCKVCATVIS